MVEPSMEAAGIEPAQDSPGRHLHLVASPEAERIAKLERTAASSACPGGWIYFVVYEDLCKIGTTIHWPRKRLATIQNMCPVTLELRAVQPGEVKVERELHHKFRRSRRHGEWFRISKAISALIGANLEKYGAPEPLFGVPEFLYRYALAETLDRDETHRKLYARQRDSRALIARLASYEQRGIEPPPSLLRALHRTSTLLSPTRGESA